MDYAREVFLWSPKAKKIENLLDWAINPFPNGLTTNVKRTEDCSVGMLRKKAQKAEKEWGNAIINQTNNGNWTTALGENLVFEVLQLLGKNPRRPPERGGYRPDWECDDEIVEVKTRNWTTTGTAGEKVPGVIYKYSDIPDIYGKKLLVVCVAYQEYEYSHGTTKLWGNISEKKQAHLDLARKHGIEFIRFSELIKPLILLGEPGFGPLDSSERREFLRQYSVKDNSPVPSDAELKDAAPPNGESGSAAPIPG